MLFHNRYKYIVTIYSNNMSWEEMSMIEEYFSRTEHYKNKYGKNTIVLMQAGSFLEVYGYSIENSKELIGSNIKEFSETVSTQSSDNPEEAKKFWSAVSGPHEDQIYVHVGHLENGEFNLAGKDN